MISYYLNFNYKGLGFRSQVFPLGISFAKNYIILHKHKMRLLGSGISVLEEKMWLIVAHHNFLYKWATIGGSLFLMSIPLNDGYLSFSKYLISERKDGELLLIKFSYVIKDHN